jgi:hypothetical protein
MLPLYRSSVLMVEQPRQLFAAEGYYQVFDGQGFPVAHVREDTSVWNFGRGSKRCPHRFHVLAPTGEPMLTLDKPWKRGLPHIYVYTPDSRVLGAIVQDLKLLGSRFLLEGPDGFPLGRIEGSLTGWNFRIFDAHECEIARISKQHTGLRRDGWRTEDRYAVEIGAEVYEPLRTLIVSGAITVDVLLHERDEEFYTGGGRAVRGRTGPPPVRRGVGPAHERGPSARAAERRAAVAERRAELAERRAERRVDAAETRAEAAEQRARRTERKTAAAETRADHAERKADEVRSKAGRRARRARLGDSASGGAGAWAQRSSQKQSSPKRSVENKSSDQGRGGAKGSSAAKGRSGRGTNGGKRR